MARILDTTQATATSVQPIKAETFTFLQTAWTNALNDLIIAFVGSLDEGIGNTAPWWAPYITYSDGEQVFYNGKFYQSAINNNMSTSTFVSANWNVVSNMSPLWAYVLYGCVNGGSGSNYNISPGAIFFNNEVFEVPAASFPATGGQIAVMNLEVLQDTNNADPVTFSDQTNHNVHNIRQIQISAGNSGTGTIGDYDGDNSVIVASQLNATQTFDNIYTLQQQMNAILGTTIPTTLPSQISAAVQTETTRAEGVENAIGASWNTAVPTLSVPSGYTGSLGGQGNSGYRNQIDWQVIGPQSKTLMLSWSFHIDTIGTPGVQRIRMQLPNNFNIDPNFYSAAQTFSAGAEGAANGVCYVMAYGGGGSTGNNYVDMVPSGENGNSYTSYSGGGVGNFDTHTKLLFEGQMIIKIQ